MKHFYLVLTLITFSIFATAEDYKVYGPQGGLAMEVTLPEDFNEDSDKCPMVILMHGIFSSKNMTAGILASRGESPAALVLVAPGSVIQDACKGGKFFSAEFDPADPPEYVKCFGIMKLGREYILTTQELDIFGTAKAYTGPVRLIHGSKDSIVPMSCSEKFVETYDQEAELIVVEGENHMITRKLRTVVSHAVSFFVSRLK